LFKKNLKNSLIITILALMFSVALYAMPVVEPDDDSTGDDTTVGTKIKNDYICETYESPDGTIYYKCQRDCPPGNTTCLPVPCGFLPCANVVGSDG